LTAGSRTGGRLVLALDTSSAVADVAVLLRSGGSGFETVAERRAEGPSTQTKMLLVSIDEALAEIGATPHDLAAVVVGTGPGTFTGVRIGVATARAAALTLDIPVLGISSLAGLVVGALLDGVVPAAVDRIVPVMDARRGQVFLSVYGKEGLGWTRRCDPVAVSPDEIGEALAAVDSGVSAADRLYVGHTGLLGGGLSGQSRASEVTARALLEGQARLRGPVDEGGDRLEGAASVTWLEQAVDGGLRASACGPAGHLGTPESVAPVYVRIPDAEQHIKKMRDPWR
jgi:tRNA threonylcarbamoyladenosine biosynthesis protein TsaB